jgi:hypothetical protein
MGMHKLTAGSGYDYLTRHVAALDATEKGHVGLATYYTERGESPGVWVGSGMDGIVGVDAGDPVTAEQMRNLFGHGLHPLAGARAHHFDGSNVTLDAIDDAMRLGTPFKVVDEATPFRVKVAKRIADLNALIGAPADAEVAASSRARIRTEVAKEFFYEEHGRDPVDARELVAQIAKDSRPRSQTVAGYDLTFSPVKSVSTLWAVADPSTAAAIERIVPPSPMHCGSSRTRRCSPGPGHRGSGRSTSTGWWRSHSATATAGLAIRTCTLTSRSLTRSRPSTDAG